MTNITTVHTYEEILRDLCHRIPKSAESSNQEQQQQQQQQHSSEATSPQISWKSLLESFREYRMEIPQSNLSKDNETLPFRSSGLTDLLVRELLLPDKDNTVTQERETKISDCDQPKVYLEVAQWMVRSLPSEYLPSLAKSVSDLVSFSQHTISAEALQQEGLVQLWMSLVTNPTTPVTVHDQLSDALIRVLKLHTAQASTTDSITTVVASQVLLCLVAAWKDHHAKSSDPSSQIASVRCATFLIRFLARLRGENFLELAKTSGGEALLFQMMRNFDDPLQQLSVLDALIQEFDSNHSYSLSTDEDQEPSVQAWLSSPELMSLVLQFLKDPLLSDVALRFVGLLSLTKSEELSLVFDHIREIPRPPSKDSERLPLVRAISQAAVSSPQGLETILHDEHLRLVWWKLTGISQSKLQAAILMSIAVALPNIAQLTVDGPQMALRLYQWIGSDNTSFALSTTEWILQKYATSPILEVRIASHALLAAILKIPNAGLLLLGAESNTRLELIENLLLKDLPGSTKDSQAAKFEVLEAFLKAARDAPILLNQDSKLGRKVLAKLALGPYGKEVRPYGADDVAIL